MNVIIKGSVESLDQMIEFIAGLSDVSYQQSPAPLFDSSIGQHLRHILDLYMALMNPTHPNNVDYDIRRRGLALERVKMEGIHQLQLVRDWLLQLDLSTLDQPLTISGEVSINSVQSAQSNSSLSRELCFASSHLTHHLALMAAIAKYVGQSVAMGLGTAPATASFLRGQQPAPCV